MGLRAGDLLDAHIDDEGRLALERVGADPLRRLRKAGHGLWHGTDGLDEQLASRAEWDR
jgi:hypothetical protein